jgi:hypothetical protein
LTNVIYKAHVNSVSRSSVEVRSSGPLTSGACNCCCRAWSSLCHRRTWLCSSALS